jgi:hypothetical protein
MPILRASVTRFNLQVATARLRTAVPALPTRFHYESVISISRIGFERAVDVGNREVGLSGQWLATKCPEGL